MRVFQHLALASVPVLLATMAGAQVTLFDTGVHQVCVFNGATTNLGWTSGDASATQPQRWTAQPFTLPPGNHNITEIEAEYFVPAANPPAIGWRIWNRTGQNAPGLADEVASGSSPFTVAGAPMSVDVDLAGGDYYLSVYALAPTGTTIGWFTNAQSGIHFIEPSNSLPFMWRSNTYPAPGFAVYQLPATTLSQSTGLDPNKLYCAAFRIRGFTEQPNCDSGSGGALADNVGGAWPVTLPGVTFSSAITLHPGATSITSIKLNGAAHTWVGDVQLVIVDPGGTAHNLVHRIGFTGSGFGNSGDFVGNYEIVETGGGVFPSSGNPAPGTYDQYFGTGTGMWPSGNAGVFNTPISAIPVVPGGVYTLVGYDWAGGDVGSIGSWEICGSAYPTPVAYCTAGTSLNGCTPLIGYDGVPSATSASGFLVGFVNADAGRFAGMVYSMSPASIPIAGSNSFLCTAMPRQRIILPLGNTGGTVGCDGSIAIDLLAFLAAHPTALGMPFSAGDTIYMQGFNRDNGVPPRNVVTTNGLMITFTP